MNWRKIAPVILVIVAVLGLWINYQTLRKMGGKKCNCSENAATPIL